MLTAVPGGLAATVTAGVRETRAMADVDLIELIDVDPGAFGPSPAARPEGDGHEGHRRGRRRRLRLPSPHGVAFWARFGMVSSVVLMVGLGVAGLLIRPWDGAGRGRYADPDLQTSELTERLVFGSPPGDLRSTSMGGLRTSEEFDLRNRAVGYFWGDPDAVLGSSRFPEASNRGRIFAFYATPSDSEGAFLITPQRTIAGAPAEVSDESDGASIDLAWGPLDGMIYRAVATNTTVDDAVAIAEEIHVEGDQVVIEHRTTLDGMKPLGSFGDYIDLFILDEFANDFDQKVSNYTGLYYGFSGHSVGSMPGRAQALDLVRHTIAPGATAGEVHGLPALGYTHGSGPFGDQDRSAVIWWEGGRLILVQGDGDLDATYALAETVRPATEAEWRAAEALDR